MSAAEGQRPRNYSSCCSWIFRLIYALSTSTTLLPQFFISFYPSIHISITLHSIFLSINRSSSIFICQSINWPLPFPKYQYIIAADPGDGIGLVYSYKGHIILIFTCKFWFYCKMGYILSFSKLHSKWSKEWLWYESH